ncbi:hypothetical protein [Paenibacillus mucilaginosus]|uniref:Uncharacterized protein n=2 Tax=Paenibacillus mucilaginosus TaxID=61624 RepID=H6NL62_9BACL|nr:hypothetical protein [Paenibacillus mucilaginosus]AEI41216.1 hypothetical protein KNP414_02655 [Paenibacillus mucilaginosus KNP414]AFC29769.1 hypothetical protein PM3016_2897 [Paenibacillus mucilaginosus 3016]MCG7211361.1 hypothetical protein [Paenibacillus mucilaginosus]WDM30256.1 hypothetical protein KCX80_14380 [Paenibacillus mucilaginosus]WFA18439.1 hypothetical protein ERY13_14750 [Paenibacillus mucilaginosus]
MGKIIRNALLFTAGIHVLFFAYQILHGMYLTYTYVPDIVDAYSSAGAMGQKVSFGRQPAFSGWDYLWTVLGGMVLYMAVVHPLLNRRRK